MTGRIGDDTLETIRERTDIVTLVSSYLQLKRSGSNHFGLCPFHSEKSPSFSVSEARQSYHCFGCGEGGDVFAFLMKMEGLSFPEAARRLAEQAGVEIPEEAPDPQADQRRREKERLWRINAAAHDYYQQVLLRHPEGEPGRDYLKKRGYDRETARSFALGYAPQGWEGLSRHLVEQGFAAEELLQLGLVRTSRDGRGHYDLFRDRLIFPIIDLGGEVAAFGGRVLGEGSPKYLNSPESPVYHKGRQLYGLYQGREAVRRSGEVLVVEGYFDLLALHRAGFENVVATCGTAMTEDHARLLKRYARKVLFLFDRDNAGLQATWKGMVQVLPLGLSGAVVELPAGDDPDSFLQREGGEAFRDCLEKARPVLEVFQEMQLADCGQDFGARARKVEEILRVLQLIPGEIERNLYLQDLATRSGIELPLLKGQLAELVSREARQQERRTAVEHAPPPATAPARPSPPMAPAGRSEAVRNERELRSQKLLLKLMTLEGTYRQRVETTGCSSLFLDGDSRVLAVRLLAAEDEAFEAAFAGEGLSPEQRALGTAVLNMDPLMVGDHPDRVFSDCLRDVERGGLRQRLKELKSLIDKAERAGDGESQAALQREFTEVNRRLK